MPVKTMAAAGKTARVFFALALLVAAGIARAELAGPVVAVLDGDTIDVLIDRQPVRVRLAQIGAAAKYRGAFGKTTGGSHHRVAKMTGEMHPMIGATAL